MSPSFPVEPQWRVMLRDVGIEPLEVLRRAELPDDLFGREGATLATAAYFRLWRALETAVGDPALPIRLAEALSTEAFYPPMFAALCSPDLRVAARRLSLYKRLILPAALEVVERPDALTLRCSWLEQSHRPPATLVASELTFVVQLARIATRTRIEPLEVTCRHRLEPADAYRRFFGCPVRSGDHDGVRFARVDAERPFLTASDAMWNAFEPELRRRLADLDAGATTRERVRAALLELLPGGQVSVEAVSRKLGLSKRTLQRRLRDEDTTFQATLDRTREQLARHYLTQTAMTGAEIAFLLGFEDPSSFFRAFSAWTGGTPEMLRNDRERQ